MEAKHISEIIQASPISPNNSLTVSKVSDSKFVECLKSKKVKDCSIEEVKQALRVVMLKIGLQSIPVEEAKAILIDHVFTNFGGNHIDEIVLAFEMAIAGKLDIEEKEVNAYENFSCLYISRIMNSYRRWALQEYRHVETKLAPVETKLLNASELPKNWGAYIENEYQHFLSFGAEKMNLWPAEFYEQLVTDGFIEKDFFRAMMHSVRAKLISDLITDKNKIQSASMKGLRRERQEFAESIRNTNLSEIEKKISAYKTGEKDKEIELAAKQASVLKLFVTAKEKFKKNIYVSE